MVIGLGAARQVIGPARDPLHYSAEIPISTTAPALLRFLAYFGRPTRTRSPRQDRDVRSGLR